ncbi:protein kinase superfamily protein [Actinidia rufa]|uniref:non-specific serine/threonine protein kinase n=1 Tax=Actinidia rufa TaxID=165716 RepID=A0A7J0GE41_9ERIC|nr:protein kinase superfamily protein [Actinidia rufa]
MSIAAIVGGVGGALAVLAIAIAFVWFFLLKHNNSWNRNSEMGSSDPSAVAELRRGEGPGSLTVPPITDPHGATQFTMEELEQATKNFHESNLIGYGSFGLVYKGLLRDGNFAAIKRRTGDPRQELVEESSEHQVAYLSGIWHRNLVTLLDTGRDSTKKLEFKQRVSIGLDAAKGLCHLHSQKPPIVHGNFKTANVLVDENFIAKVADAGIWKLLQRIEDAGPSGTTRVNPFQDPEVVQMGIFSQINDVYSFGVFLLELVTGQEASHIDSFGSNERILQWVETHLSSNDFVDRRLVGSFTAEGMKDFIRLTLQCMSFPGKRRPKMEMIELELDRILEKEITRTTVTGEGSTTVILGSQLFTSE